ncbi:hypothetical protein SCYAM73S_00628 [Streptomyces cyaneofuscatus]
MPHPSNVAWTDPDCPVARTLDLVGDRWSLLVVRDAMDGARSFTEFQRRTGIARNILSDRLRKLSAHGLLTQQTAPTGRRLEYVLTDRGRDLFPVLLTLRQWGERHAFDPGERSRHPRFANTGTPQTRAREAAAFLTHADFESVGLKYVKEINEANYWRKCDDTQPFGCPAGREAYYGRGPIMFSWNFNYKAAGDALGLDLLNDPWLVERDPSVAWRTALWYWNTQNGPGTMTSHEAMVGGAGFGETIRSLNGALECDGGNPPSVAARVQRYERITGILDVAPGSGLTC